MTCGQLCMKAGMSKELKYFPIPAICEKLQYEPIVLETLLRFHALTGYDATSFIAVHNKKTTWKAFQ